MGAGVIRVERNGAAEGVDGTLPLGGRLAQVVQPLIVRLVRRSGRRPQLIQSTALGRRQDGADPLRDRPGDFGLQSQRIPHRTLELLSPDLRVAPRRDQPGVDAHPIGASILGANDQQGRLDDVVHGQLLPDRDHRRGPVTERQHGRQRPHLQRTYLAERRDQLIGELVGEVGRGRFARNVPERQDSHARDRRRHDGGRRAPRPDKERRHEQDERRRRRQERPAATAAWLWCRGRRCGLHRDGRRQVQRFAQPLLQLADASISPGRIRVQCPLDHADEAFGHVRPHITQRLTPAIRVRPPQLLHRRGDDRKLSGDEVEEQDADAIEIALDRGFLTSEDLGRQIERCPDETAGAGESPRLSRSP